MSEKIEFNVGVKQKVQKGHNQKHMMCEYFFAVLNTLLRQKRSEQLHYFVFYTIQELTLVFILQQVKRIEGKQERSRMRRKVRRVGGLTY
jgi:hypothetical protein